MAAKATELVDFEEIVKEWAWQMFDITKSSLPKDLQKVPKEHLQLNVDWRRVKFEHSEPEFVDKVKPSEPKSVGLFRTYFTNHTENVQEYSFKTERTTVSSCDVEIEKGYTIGYEMNIGIRTPCEILEASAGFSRELSVTNTFGQSFEEVLSWGVDSVIKVPAKHKTSAELIVSEDNLETSFSMTTTATGRVHVTVTNSKDNNTLVKSLDGKLGEIFRNASNNGFKGFQVDKNVVSYVTKGQCKFKYAIEQHVKVSQERLDE